MALSIRPARPGDAPLVVQFVRELAEYEKLSHECETTEAMIDEALFSPSPRLFCDIAEWDGAPVGNAVWFLNFSTFTGRHGIYLEDLFVRPAFRHKGIGKGLMVNLRATLRRARLDALRMGGAGLEYALDRFLPVDRRPAQSRVVRTICRVSGDALKRTGRPVMTP